MRNALWQRLRNAAALGPDELAFRLLDKGRHRLRDPLMRWSDSRRVLEVGVPAGRCLQLLDDVPRPCPGEGHAYLARARRLLQHEIDLLGSGPVVIDHGCRVEGIHGFRYDAGAKVVPDQTGDWLAKLVLPSHLSRARAVWRLTSANYRPLDWQRDFKSGYRWSETTWYWDVPIGKPPGADIKVPWELARMQHLPQLAVTAAYARDFDPELARRCVREIFDQCLDFIATNPPRFGANWRCAMEVAIRAVNWLVTFDLLAAQGITPSVEIEDIIVASIAEHRDHVSRNLEWRPRGRNNHYLADLAGLVVISAYFDDLQAVHKHLDALRCETLEQFRTEGSNVEGSTGYHRLSAEIVAFAVAVVRGYERKKGIELVGKTLQARIVAAAHFTAALLDERGRVPQIGDHDDGRFIALDRGDPLEHAALPALLGCALGDVTDERLGLDAQLAAALARAMPRQATPPAAPAPHVSFPGFGVHVYRRGDLYCSIRLVEREDHDSGHAHEDQLSLTLSIGGQDFLVDPGSYVYTSLPDLHARFASCAVHNTLVETDGHAPRAMKQWLGRRALRGRAKAMTDAFEGEACGRDIVHYRRVEIDERGIRIRDRVVGATQIAVGLMLSPAVTVARDGNTVVLCAGAVTLQLNSREVVEARNAAYSPRYGRSVATQQLILRGSADALDWSITRA